MGAIMRKSITEQLADLQKEVIRLEVMITTQFGVLMQAMGQRIEATTLAAPPKAETPASLTEDAVRLFRSFTPKQHVVLQMLLAGEQNDQIAERLEIALNTAKVHVRLIARKLGVNTRAQVVITALPYFEAISEEAYARVSQGLPKNWHRTYKRPDEYRDVYMRGD